MRKHSAPRTRAAPSADYYYGAVRALGGQSGAPTVDRLLLVGQAAV
jgi:hypothetical protein